MGIAIVDNRASGGVLQERQTSTCHSCSAIIEYESKPLGGFLRKVRVSKRRLPDGTYQSHEDLTGGYWCHYHDADMCGWCGELSAKRKGRCVSMEQRAEATATAINHKVDVWSQEGRLYIENLLDRRMV